jgi:hypothetical protein
MCIYMYILSYYEGFTLVTCTRVYIDTQIYVVRALSIIMYIFNSYYAEALYPTVYSIAYNLNIIISNIHIWTRIPNV